MALNDQHALNHLMVLYLYINKILFLIHKHPILNLNLYVKRKFHDLNNDVQVFKLRLKFDLLLLNQFFDIQMIK